MLSIAKGILEEEEREREEAKRRYIAETCPPVSMPRTMQELQARHKRTPTLVLRMSHRLATWLVNDHFMSSICVLICISVG